MTNDNDIKFLVNYIKYISMIIDDVVMFNKA